MQVTTIGLDLAKHWFQVHGVNAGGAVAVRRKLRRSEVRSCDRIDLSSVALVVLARFPWLKFSLRMSACRSHFY